jgi:hypothetical protein
MLNEGIAAKIAKIIAKAERTTHEAEAELFMAKAHEMMLAHGIELADLGQLDAQDAVGESLDAWRVRAAEGWAYKLSNVVARYYGCRIVGWNFNGGKMESARATTIVMVPYIVRQVRKLAYQAAKEGAYRSASQARTAIAKALTIRIWRLCSEAQVRVDATGHGTALVPVDQIEAFITSQVPNLKTGKDRTRYNLDPTAKEIASRVSLNLQATGKAAPKLGRA